MSNLIGWLNLLLRDIAHKVQLSATDYRLAQDRYCAVSDYICAAGSAIAQFSPLLYPQGSFRIQSTISSSLDRDEYDIDLMLELVLRRDLDPDTVLELVRGSIDRGFGSRYHGKVTKKKRCVTIDYDNMHLDITPAVLIPEAPERTCVIFDRHPERSDHVLSNPEGFACWFESRTLSGSMLAEVRKAAVPNQAPLEDKSIALLALQLLKRWRNVHYDDGEQKPPSVVLAYLVAECQARHGSLLDALMSFAAHMHRRVSDSNFQIINPQCPLERFTDRWPANTTERDRFVRELGEIHASLAAMRSVEEPLYKKRETLQDLFGEAVTQLAFNSVNERLGKCGSDGVIGFERGSGAVRPWTVQGSMPLIASHEFFGNARDL